MIGISGMIVDRVWEMPNKNTFSIQPVAELIRRYRIDGLSIDPFANGSKLAHITNDLDTDYDTDYHLDATDFLQMFKNKSIDMVLYDPPYSSRQVSESYRKMERAVNMQTTDGSYWRKHKEEIGRIVRPGGIVISCGWNSGGMGYKYGFSMHHVRLIAHGGHHNDTIRERLEQEENAEIRRQLDCVRCAAALASSICECLTISVMNPPPPNISHMPQPAALPRL